jgi:hypothetical protein
MKIVRLIGLLTLLVELASGQGINPDPSYTVRQEMTRHWVVKFAPFSLFDPSNTIQFGIERMLGQRQAVQLEFGYGWQGMNLWRNSQGSRYTDTEIWRGRAEWRYYWQGGPIGSYMAIEGLYKRINAFENGTIGIGCTNGPCQYYQLYSSPISKYVWAGHLKFGRQFRLSANNRLLGDFYGGLGIRGNTIERITQPDGFYYYQSRGLFDLFSNSTYAVISVSYGMKIGYSF